MQFTRRKKLSFLPKKRQNRILLKVNFRCFLSVVVMHFRNDYDSIIIFELKIISQSPNQEIRIYMQTSTDIIINVHGMRSAKHAFNFD